jgi:uncharacterized membrane protein
VLKKLVLLPVRVLEHNKEHSIKLRILGEEIHACSRCLGAYTAGSIFFPLFGYLYVQGVVLPFYPVFITSIVLGSLTLIDYASIDIFHKREGNNKIRVIAGFLLGLAAMLYFWLLPVNWYIRIGTLLFYNILAILIAYTVERRVRHGAAQTHHG